MGGPAELRAAHCGSRTALSSSAACLRGQQVKHFEETILSPKHVGRSRRATAAGITAIAVGAAGLLASATAPMFAATDTQYIQTISSEEPGAGASGWWSTEAHMANYGLVYDGTDGQAHYKFGTPVPITEAALTEYLTGIRVGSTSTTAVQVTFDVKHQDGTTSEYGAADFSETDEKPANTDWGVYGDGIEGNTGGKIPAVVSSLLFQQGTVKITGIDIGAYEAGDVVTSIRYDGDYYVFGKPVPENPGPKAHASREVSRTVKSCETHQMTVVTVPASTQAYIWDEELWSYKLAPWTEPAPVTTTAAMNTEETAACGDTSTPSPSATPTKTPSATPTPTATPKPEPTQPPATEGPKDVNPDGKNTVTETVATAGELFHVTGKGFKANENVRVELHSDPVVLGSFVADKDGNLEADVPIPASVPAGVHHIVMFDQNNVSYESAAITVAEVSGGDEGGSGAGDDTNASAGDENNEIPGLGMDASVFSIASGSLLILGVVLLLFGRRRSVKLVAL